MDEGVAMLMNWRRKRWCGLSRARLAFGSVLLWAILFPNAVAQAAEVKVVQSGTATSSGNGTVTVTINAVDTTKAFLIFQTRHNSNRPVGSMIRGQIASSTTLQFARVTDESSTMQIQWYVVEFTSGVNVQRGQVTQSSSTMNVGITPVASLSQAFVTWSKTPKISDSSWSSDDPLVGELTSTSNLQLQANDSNSSHIVWWQVIEFTDPADINVQKDSTSLTGSSKQRDVTLSTPVDVNKTFVLVGFRTDDDGSDVRERMLRAQLIDADEIRIDREEGGDDITEIVWQVVELKDASVVQRGSEDFNTGTSQRTVSINPVDTSRAVAFASVQPAGGQNMGRSDYSGDDVIGVGSVTMSLSSNNVTMQRSNTAADADIGWFVVEWGQGPQLFTDVSSATGFGLQTTTDDTYGSGLHWGDLDGDGDLDSIITGNSVARLMINNGAGSSFTSSTFGGGNVRRQGALVDLDNDDDLDFWSVGINSYDNEACLQNDASASFSNVGNLGFNNPDNNEAVAAADVNHDGWCDIVMFSEDGNWIGHHQGGPSVSLVGTKNTSYGLNDSGDDGNGDYCSSGDVNNDGYLDFFYHYNGGKLFFSDADGTYTQNNYGISVVTGNSDKMGSAWGDYDNDGDLDLFVSRRDSGSTGYLWRNGLNLSASPPTGTFTNVTSSSGITDASGQRGCCWGDYDNDGDLDLYVVTRSGNANVLYQNQGSPSWGFVAVSVGTSASGDGHDAVFVDYDNDGDLDLSITQEDATNTLLRNNTDNTDYLKVRAIGCGAPRTNKAAVGIRVELWDAAGTTFLARREIGVARGYAGTEPMWLHFGGVTNSSTYTVKTYFDSLPVSAPLEISVVPASASTTIGSTTIPQMLTVQEPCTPTILQWREVRN